MRRQWALLMLLGLFILGSSIFSVRMLVVARNLAVQEFPLPGGRVPFNIVTGPNKELWFSERNKDLSLTNRIGRITTAGIIKEYILPVSWINDLATFKDGNLWFTAGPDLIGCMTPAGNVKLFHTLHGHTPHGLSYNAGYLWFIAGTASIGYIAHNGTVKEFVLPKGSGLINDATAQLSGGPDGSVWVTEPMANRIGRISPTGKLTEFPIPSEYGGPGKYKSSMLTGITSGPDGSMWFIETLTGKIGRVTPHGVFHEFSAGNTISPYACRTIKVGPDGNLWYACEDDQLIRFTPKGAYTVFHTPTPYSDPYGITVGPDRSIWFTESSVGKIGRLILS